MTPFLQSNRTVHHAFFAQDQWTVKRLTVQAGLRYEHAFSFGPGGGENAVLPNRFNPTGVEFPRSEGITGSNDGIYTSSNPAFSYQYTTTRTWLDFNGNKVPDCNLNNPAEQIGADLCS